MTPARDIMKISIPVPGDSGVPGVPGAGAGAGARRGNTLVLVTGILVLLVIIATAYVTRTQAGRVTSSAIGAAHLNDDDTQLIADNIASEIAEHLFVRPVDSTLVLPGSVNADANHVRLPTFPDAVRYARDERDLNPPFDGVPDTFFSFNFAPYSVVPWTNWPDSFPADVGWPIGDGNDPNGAAANPPHPNSLLWGEDNPRGNPGYGDHRWLRDLEPLRWDSDGDRVLDSFSHWRHMTNIARPENGWRIVSDISDVGDSTGPGGLPDGLGLLVTNMNVPCEQFLIQPHNALASATGDTDVVGYGLAAFMNNWNDWFGLDPVNGLNGYKFAYAVPSFVPPNYIRLSNLDADIANGLPLQHEVGERPQDEFAGPGVVPGFPDGTPRWTVGRVLADTDGDGYTDSFWFLAPTSLHSGVRQVVAISIVDNQGMFNLNAATRFVRNNSVGGGTTDQKTRGILPTDLSLVGQIHDVGVLGCAAIDYTYNVGLFDNPANWILAGCGPGGMTSTYAISGSQWGNHLLEVGLHTGGANPQPLWYPDTLTRLAYWRLAASNPFSPSIASGYSQFDLSDELELRMYARNNYPWIQSRLENTITPTGGPDGILRSTTDREESNEFLDQLPNWMQLVDLRGRATTYSNVRNDIMPSWLWDATHMYATFDPAEAARREVRRRKIDLRRVDLDFEYDDPIDPVVNLPDADWDGDLVADEDELDLERLRDVIERCLLDAQPNLPGNPGTYYGLAFPADVRRTRRLAAAFAANIIQRRDADVYSPIREAIAPRSDAVTMPPNVRYLGIEPQPFITEAFIGHVYNSYEVTDFDVNGTEYTNAGNNVVVDDDGKRSTIVVVQLANPFNQPISLDDFRVRVFGQAYDIPNLPTGLFLGPAVDDHPTTLTLVAIKSQLTGDALDSLRDRWIDFFDLDRDGADNNFGTIDDDLTANSHVLLVPDTAWSVDDRSDYDDFTTGDAITLERDDAFSGASVVTDRIDPPGDREFGDDVNAMEDTAPDAAQPPAQHDAPDDPAGAIYPSPVNGVDLGPASLGYNHWVQWVRVTRAWGADLDADFEYDDNERNPRYVFGSRAVVNPAGIQVTDPSEDGPTFINEGNRYKFLIAPDTPWFTRDYRHINNTVVTTRKPTFFDMNHKADPVWQPPLTGQPRWSYPDKGWYNQGDSPDNDVRDAAGVLVPAVLDFPLQMLHRNGDFEHVGELFNTWLFGHEIEVVGATVNTITTFSEHMVDMSLANLTPQIELRVNRLDSGQIIGATPPGVAPDPNDPRHGIPDLRAGTRILDAFVCDGYGVSPTDFNLDGVVDASEAEQQKFLLAKGFDGSGTPALINVNTASYEVMRALPHWFKLVREFDNGFVDNVGNPLVSENPDPTMRLPRVMLPESLWQYRERFNAGAYDPDFNPPAPAVIQVTGIPFAPNYENRVGPRGLVTPAEILTLDRPANGIFGQNTPDQIEPTYWQADMGVAQAAFDPAAPKPFWDDPGLGGATRDQVSMRVSTDRIDEFNPDCNNNNIADGLEIAQNPSLDTVPAPNGLLDACEPPNDDTTTRFDRTAGDLEEANMLFSGVSNLLTTRSDAFTVYFRVRSFRQNTSVNPPVWDATNPEYIIDDSRYVMLVDRSNVNRPGQKPRILYMEKLPN